MNICRNLAIGAAPFFLAALSLGPATASAQEAPTVGLAISTSSLAENGGTATVTASLSATSTEPITVPLSFSGTAGKDSDYNSSDTQIVIAPGDTSGSITVTALDDALSEGIESITVTSSTPVNAGSGTPAEVSATITDDDTPAVSLSISATTLAENGGAATVTASLSSSSTEPVTVPLSFSGTAGKDSDYSTSDTQIVIAPGNLNGHIDLSLINDSLNEGTEQITVALDTPINASVGTPDAVSATITDDDSTPKVSLAISAANLPENGGAATVTATLTAASGKTVTVPLTFSGTASKGADYSASAEQIVIAPGNLSGHIDLSLVNDSLDEDAEKITVTRGTPVNAAAGTPAAASATINDDDPAPRLGLAISAANLPENGGVATVTANLTAASGKTVTVPLTFSGTASKGADYSVSAEQIVIAPGSLNGHIDLSLVSDSLNESAEKITVTRGTPVNAAPGSPAAASTTITDDDPEPTVSLRASTANIPENGGTATVTATLSAASGRAVTVPLKFSGTASKGADYSSSGDQILIAPGSSSAAITLSAINDSLDEAGETAVLSISRPTNAAAAAPTSVSVLVADNDPPPTISLSSSAGTLDEQAGTVTVTAQLSEASGRAITAQMLFSGTATRDADYASSSTQLAINAGQTSATLTLTGIDDETVESSERIMLKLGTLGNATAGIRPTLSISIPGTDMADNRPNIVMLILDDGSEELMDQGAVANYFPRLHQNLYRYGTYYPNYHLTTSLCGPSRTSVLRGQFAHNHHIKTNSPPDEGSAPGAPTGGFGEFYRQRYADEDLGVWLQRAGYRSAMVGKYVNNGFPGESGSTTYTPPGWDEFYGAVSGSYFDTGRLINGVRVTNPAGVYRTDQERDEAVRLINEHFQSSTARKPLFLYLAPFSPHFTTSPKGMVAPRFADSNPQCVVERQPNFNEADISDKGSFMQVFPLIDNERIQLFDVQQRNRMRSILATDELFGAVFDALGSEVDNTYIFFSTDNGFFMGQHRIGSTKILPYTRGVSAPLVVRGPGVAAGATQDHLLMNIDLLPTMTDIAERPAPAYVDGKSMLPVLHGLIAPGSWRQSVLLENWESVGVREQDEETNQHFYEQFPAEYSQIRTANYSYIRWANGDREYYDFQTDPYQLDNQASTLSPSRRDQLDALLEQWKNCSRDSCRSSGDIPAP